MLTKMSTLYIEILFLFSDLNRQSEKNALK